MPLGNCLSLVTMVALQHDFTGFQSLNNCRRLQCRIQISLFWSHFSLHHNHFINAHDQNLALLSSFVSYKSFVTFPLNDVVLKEALIGEFTVCLFLIVKFTVCLFRGLMAELLHKCHKYDLVAFPWVCFLLMMLINFDCLIMGSPFVFDLFA